MEPSRKLYTMFESPEITGIPVAQLFRRPDRKNNLLFTVILSTKPGGSPRLPRYLQATTVSIKNIGIVHNREFEEGVLRIEFYDEGSLKMPDGFLENIDISSMRFKENTYEKGLDKKMELCSINGLKGTITVPGDKSVSHRCIMFGSIANGITEVENFLKGADCRATIQCFRTLGIEIEENGSSVRIHGKGLHRLIPPTDILDVGKTRGTTTRLFARYFSRTTF